MIARVVTGPTPVSHRCVLMAVLSAVLAWHLGCDSPPGPSGTDSSTASSQSAESTGDAARHAFRFRDVAQERGLVWTTTTAPLGQYRLPEIIGGGVGLVDLDNDNDLDVVLVPIGTAGDSQLRIALFRQEASGRFSDISPEAGLVIDGAGMGVAAGDVNNDGRVDLYISSTGRDRLFLNRGEGRFVDCTEVAQLGNPEWGVSSAFVDYDRDGWLDLVVVNYVDEQSRVCAALAVGSPDYCSPLLFPGTAIRLYRNETTVPGTLEPRFRDVSLSSGVGEKQAAGLGLLATDLTEDGLADLYIANDQTANHFYVGQADGRFLEDAVASGCAVDQFGRPQASMGVACGDLDRDGRLDLVLTHLDGEYHTQYRGVGGGLFDDVSPDTGLAALSVPYTGFGVTLSDFDLDGDLDLAAAQGRVRRGEGLLPDAADIWAPYRQPQFLARNERGTWQAVPEPNGLTERRAVGRGLAAGDIDNDGDVDLLVAFTGEQVGLYLNESPRLGHWVRVRVTDSQRGGRDAIGAVVTLEAGSEQWTAHVLPGQSYLSTGDARVHVGVGGRTRIDALEVRWPDGTTQRFPGGPVDRQYDLIRTP